MFQVAKFYLQLLIRKHGISIEWLDHIKYLGVVLDSKLSFSRQIDQVNNKVSSGLGAIYSVSRFLTRDVLVSLYYSLMYSQFIQNIIIWGGRHPSKTAKIKIAVNKALRIILNVQYDNYIPLIRTDILYKNLNILKFEHVYQLFILKFLHYILYDNETLFKNHMMPLLPNSNYNTRLNNRFNFPYTRLNSIHQSTIHNCVKLANDLPNSLIEPQSKHSLKIGFKKFILDSY